MATTTPRILHPNTENEMDLDFELSDRKVEALLQSGDVEGAREEFERSLLASLDSGDAMAMPPEKWEDLRLELHREARIAS